MRCVVAIGLLACLSSVVCEDDRVETDAIEPPKPKPIGLIYLIHLISRPESQNENSEISNVVPTGYVFPQDQLISNNKLLAALKPKEIEREKRAATPTHHFKKGYGGYGGHGGYGGNGGYGGQGGCCNSCGGCGGGGYPGHGGGGGGGGGISGSWSQSSSSAGSFSSGGGYGYGKK